MSPKTLKSQESQANIIVWIVFCYQKSGNSSKYNGLDCFCYQKTHANIMVWIVFVIQSPENKANIMVWAGCKIVKFEEQNDVFVCSSAWRSLNLIENEI